MVEKKKWKQFQDTGLLWWINTLLHTFGWAIVLEIKDGEITDCYPARVKFRGFGDKQIDEGYQKVSKYLLENSEQLYKETIE